VDLGLSWPAEGLQLTGVDGVFPQTIKQAVDAAAGV
jgi:hypothetical protein